MFKNLYYKLLLFFNWWQECDEPQWVIKSHEHYNIYDGIYFFNGKTFQYKVLSKEFGQGWSDTVCYKRYMKHVLRKRAG